MHHRAQTNAPITDTLAECSLHLYMVPLHCRAAWTTEHARIVAGKPSNRGGGQRTPLATITSTGPNICVMTMPAAQGAYHYCINQAPTGRIVYIRCTDLVFGCQLSYFGERAAPRRQWRIPKADRWRRATPMGDEANPSGTEAR